MNLPILTLHLPEIFNRNALFWLGLSHFLESFVQVLMDPLFLYGTDRGLRPITKRFKSVFLCSYQNPIEFQH